MNRALTFFFLLLTAIGATLVIASVPQGHLTLGTSGVLIAVPSAVIAFSIFDRGDQRSLLERVLGPAASRFSPPDFQPELKPGRCPRCQKKMRAGLLAFDEQWCAKGCGAWISKAGVASLRPATTAQAAAGATCPGCKAGLGASLACERCGGRWLDASDAQAIGAKLLESEPGSRGQSPAEQTAT